MTPYQRILRAARRGTGCRLSADETALLADDDAIVAVASADSERQAMSSDEADHYDCFVPLEWPHWSPQLRLTGQPACAGDGWYRCPECAEYKKHKEK